jgi:hypothetical protein
MEKEKEGASEKEAVFPIKTTASEVFSQMTVEDDEELFKDGPIYSEATLLKHKWVLNIYEPLCKVKNVEPFPIDPKFIRWFLRFVCNKCLYAIGSVKSIIIPSLIRMHKEKTKQTHFPKIRESIVQAMKEIEVSKRFKRGGEGKEAMIASDVKRVIEATSCGLLTKAAESSLWLFSLNTGARAVTCAHVRLADIVSVCASSREGMTLVEVLLTVTKGNDHWNHVVTIEGIPHIRSDTDVVYWLSEHIRTQFKLELCDLAECKDEEMKKKLLWPN